MVVKGKKCCLDVGRTEPFFTFILGLIFNLSVQGGQDKWVHGLGVGAEVVEEDLDLDIPEVSTLLPAWVSTENWNAVGDCCSH